MNTPSTSTAAVGDVSQAGGVENALAGMGVSADQQQAQPNVEQHKQLFAWIKSKNIAADLEEQVLNTIGQTVRREYDVDWQSCAEWRDKTEKAMELAMQVSKQKSYPWPKASSIVFPLLTSAAYSFAARAYPAIINNRNVVKGVVVGNDDGVPAKDQSGQPVMDPTGQPRFFVQPGAKKARADAIGDHMSYQLLDEQTEWEPETDELLHILPIVGCVFRKSYFDPSHGRNMSLLVYATNLVINYKAKSVDLAPRLSEELKLYPIEIEELERAGLFRKITYTQPADASGDDDAPHDFVEQHRRWDLDDDGYAEPYIITVHKQSSQVVRITARYRPQNIFFDGTTHQILRIVPTQFYTQYDFLPNIEGGIYGTGFGQLLKPINEAVNTTLNMLIDAGHLSNTGGGFVGKGLSMNTGTLRFSPGEYKIVNTTGAAVRDAVVQLQFPAPSEVLFKMLGMLIEAGKEIAGVKDILTGEIQNANVPATTVLALIEQGLNAFTAIYKRIHRALKSELKKLYDLNAEYLPLEASYRVGDNWKQITKADYERGSGVEPISDPTMISNMQKLGRAQVLIGLKDDPMMNKVEIIKQFLESVQIPNADSLINKNPPPPPPQVVAKGLELEQKGRQIDSRVARDKAAEVKDLANAVLLLAQSDKLVGDEHLAVLGHNLQVLRAQLESMQTVQPGGQGGQGGQGDQGTPQPAAPPMAPPLAGPAMPLSGAQPLAPQP